MRRGGARPTSWSRRAWISSPLPPVARIDIRASPLASAGVKACTQVCSQPSTGIIESGCVSRASHTPRHFSWPTETSLSLSGAMRSMQLMPPIRWIIYFSRVSDRRSQSKIVRSREAE